MAGRRSPPQPICQPAVPARCHSAARRSQDAPRVATPRNEPRPRGLGALGPSSAPSRLPAGESLRLHPLGGRVSGRAPRPCGAPAAAASGADGGPGRRRRGREGTSVRPLRKVRQLCFVPSAAAGRRCRRRWGSCWGPVSWNQSCFLFTLEEKRGRKKVLRSWRKFLLAASS